MTADDIIEVLGLEPHPKEGGFFKEVYRAKDSVDSSALPERFSQARAFSTAIYYLLTPNTFSHLHTVESDELFHFYLGDPVDMLQLFPDGSGKHIVIGSDLKAGQRPLITVPAGVWQGCRLKPGGRFALMGCTVSPGFEYEDYTHAVQDELINSYPDFAGDIEALTIA